MDPFFRLINTKKYFYFGLLASARKIKLLPEDNGFAGARGLQPPVPWLVYAYARDDRKGAFSFQRISVLLRDSFVSVHCPQWGLFRRNFLDCVSEKSVTLFIFAIIYSQMSSSFVDS